MTQQLPIIYSAHHASDNFGAFSSRCALTREQRVRYSDYGTDITVPKHGSALLIGSHSRGIVDLNRELGNHDFFRAYDFAQPTPNNIWLSGQMPSKKEHEAIFNKVYLPYHEKLMQAVRSLHQPGIVVGWDNTAHYLIGDDDLGVAQMMKPFIVSNRGAEGSTDVSQEAKDSGEKPTCDPEFLLALVDQLQPLLIHAGFPKDIYLNHVFKGGHIVEKYNTLRHPELHLAHPVQSFQVEYDTSLTHDQKTLEQDTKAMVRLRGVFETAIARTYIKYFR